MKKTVRFAVASLLALSLTTQVRAADSADKEVFIKCLAIAQDQYDRDPDPKMKEHWADFRATYLASAYHYAQSVDFVRDSLRPEMEKFDNMRNMLGSEKVDGLALMLLKRCDKDVMDNSDRWPAFEKAMVEWQKTQ